MLSMATLKGFAALIIVPTVYGYVESILGAGGFFSIAVGVYLVVRRTSWLDLLAALISVATSMYAWIQQEKTLGLVAIIILGILVARSQHAPDDTVVEMRYYEPEIRDYLFRRQPALLHKVDSMLDKYRGKEKQLLSFLMDKYGDDSMPIVNDGSGSNPNTPLMKGGGGGSGGGWSSSNPGSAIKTPISSGRNPTATPAASAGSASFSSSRPSPNGMRNTTHPSVTINRIHDLLAKHDPSSLTSLPAMLKQYEGHEMELLVELQDEFGVSPSASASATTTPSRAAAAAAQQHRQQQQQQYEREVRLAQEQYEYEQQQAFQWQQQQQEAAAAAQRAQKARLRPSPPPPPPPLPAEAEYQYNYAQSGTLHQRPAAAAAAAATSAAAASKADVIEEQRRAIQARIDARIARETAHRR